MTIIDMILPKTHHARPGYTLQPAYITIHNTGNNERGADAQRHGWYLLNLPEKKFVSWHFTVDDKRIVQHLPETEVGWHAGDGNGGGNRSSIGIEICENEEGDFNQAVSQAVQLIRSLQSRYHIPLSHVVSHRHWSGKNCPRKLLPVWQDFKRQIEGSSTNLKPNDIGHRVESIYKGALRFYTEPSWKDQHVAGYLYEGYGFPTILSKITVGNGEQYKVKNSRNDIYYVTASPKFVKVVR
ncbi:N-acetylmuramoyl-L-alanine amidase family protein [Thalassobacillus sp. CUG 92003]|uniref:peptidoglycan recognition protein family protein n=1 Tax=Thalassobacillus sp. CUG 92003 TaxID=2736641 RepID=UPI0015E6E093|nr:N-acetylmuramoyl-L-alanine amidase [Thalassobacillus sp. CUG 92003]